MINIYESYRDANGNPITDRTILFLRDSDIDEYGNIKTYAAGPGVAADVSGRVLIVDDWLIPQLDKVQFKDGVLSVKEGEELIPPVKTEKELQREALLKQLAELDSQPTE